MYLKGLCCCCCLPPSTIFKTVSKNTNVDYQVSIESAQKLYCVAYCLYFLEAAYVSKADLELLILLFHFPKLGL